MRRSRIPGAGAVKSPLPLIVSGFQWLTGSGAVERRFCPCSQCRSDVLALALSNLPGGYCLSHHYGVGRGRIDAQEVRRQIQASLRRVGGRPRHSPADPIPGVGEVRLVDFGMKVGAPLVGPLLQRIGGACTCGRCRADTLAYGLNRTRTRYGVEVRGRVRMPPHELDFIRHDLLVSLHDAAQAVARNPRHETGEGAATEL